MTHFLSASHWAPTGPTNTWWWSDAVAKKLEVSRTACPETQQFKRPNVFFRILWLLHFFELRCTADAIALRAQNNFVLFSKAAPVAMLKMACCLGSRLDGGFWVLSLRSYAGQGQLLNQKWAHLTHADTLWVTLCFHKFDCFNMFQYSTSCLPSHTRTSAPKVCLGFEDKECYHWSGKGDLTAIDAFCAQSWRMEFQMLHNSSHDCMIIVFCVFCPHSCRGSNSLALGGRWLLPLLQSSWSLGCSSRRFHQIRHTYV